MSETIYTIGHSTHPIDEFLQILKAYQIETLVDVRTIPQSRHNPQFNTEDLRQELEKGGLAYLHLAGLGGLRHTTSSSINTAWKNPSFRGYADYMQTPEFSAALGQLIDLSTARRVAIMCAEALPWRCHRSLIGDALLARNLLVEDIYSETSSKPHKLTPWAKVEGEKVTYPAQAES